MERGEVPPPLDVLPDIQEFRGDISKRVLLHHSHRKLAGICNMLFGDGWKQQVKCLDNEDFPMINVVYRDTPVTLVTTRMGIDPTLWILDQLKWCGVEYVVKLGTFVALQWSVKLGDIYAPDTAAVTNPGSVAPYSPSGTNLFRPNTSLRDRIVRTDVGGLVKGGTILTYPWVRAKVRGKSKLPNREYEYDLDKNPDGYFGLEMECAAVFAVAQVLGMKGAAVLVCNRTYRTLLTGEEWTAHTTSESYKQGYAKAVEIAFDAFVNRPTIPAVEGVVRP